MQIFFYIVIFFGRGGEGGLKLGLFVFHHNNNFNLVNIYSAKTITIAYKKSYGSIYGVNKSYFSAHIFNIEIYSYSNILRSEAKCSDFSMAWSIPCGSEGRSHFVSHLKVCVCKGGWGGGSQEFF